MPLWSVRACRAFQNMRLGEGAASQQTWCRLRGGPPLLNRSDVVRYGSFAPNFGRRDYPRFRDAPKTDIDSILCVRREFTLMWRCPLSCPLFPAADIRRPYRFAGSIASLHYHGSSMSGTIVVKPAATN